jgi:hypothetical protein
MICTVNNSDDTRLLTALPDTTLVRDAAMRLHKILLAQRRRVELSPTLPTRYLDGELSLQLLPLVERPKLPATAAANEPEPTVALQLVRVALDARMLVESDNRWKLRALTRHDV